MLKGLSSFALRALPLLLLSAPAWAGSTLSYTIGGSTAVFTSSQGTFAASGSAANGATFTFQGSGEPATLSFKASAGQTLAPGIYDDAQDFFDNGTLQPSMEVSAAGTGCDNLPGRFVVRAITSDGSGKITSLAVDFQQNCADTSFSLTGSLRFNSSLPIPFNAPTADAGPNQSVLQQATVTLDGSLSDGGSGHITAYHWTQTGGSPLVTLSTSTAVKPTFTAPDVGPGGTDLQFRLEVDGSVGAPNFATVIVHVRNPADPYTILAMTADPGEELLSGSMSLDATQASFTPAVLAGNASNGAGAQMTVNDGTDDSWTLQFAAPRGQSLQVGMTYDLATSYPFEAATAAGLSVSGECTSRNGRFVVLDIQTDVSGKISAFAADFEEHCDNEAPALHGKIRYNSSVPLDEPFVNPGIPQVLEQGTTVTLSAADSDAGGEGESIVSYQWTQLSGPGVQLSSPTGATTTFTAPGVSAGGADLVFQLTITNSAGLTSTDIVTVHVAAPGDPLTLFYAASDAGDTVGQGMATSFTNDQATFTASAVVSSTDNNIQFGVQATGGTTWLAEFMMPTNQPLQVGTYPYASAFDDTRTTTLAGLEVWPVLSSCDSVTGNFTILDIQMSGNTVTSFAADFEQHCNGAGPALRGKIRYNSTIEGHAPIAVAGQLQRATQGTTVNLSSAGSDPGATGGVTITGYQWTQLSGVSATLSDPTLPDPSFTAPVVPPGGSDLVFQLTVTNSLGLTAASDVTVHVLNPSDPPFLTEFYADSDKGDPVGRGKTISLDTSVSTFRQFARLLSGGSSANSIELQVNGTTSWDMEFAALANQALQVGKTDDLAVQYPWQPPVLPGLDVENIEGGGPCNDVGGHFAVLDLQVDPYGKISSAAIDFEQQCVGATGSLHGRYRYNSDVPLDTPFADAGPAQIVPQESTVQLVGHNSYTGSLTDTITSYQWSQVSGQTVTLSDATMADPTFSAPDVSAGGADLVFQLTVTNSEGLSGSDTVNIHVSNSADPVTALRMTSDPGDTAGEGQSVNLTTLMATFTPEKLTNGNGHTVQITVDPGALNEITIDLAPSQGQMLEPGTDYPNATTYINSTSASPEIDIDDCFEDANGEFIIRDIQVTADGTLLSLAADFVQHCGYVTPALHGKIRYNSTYPMDDPVANAGTLQEVTQGDTVTLSGSGTDAGGDGTTVTSWQWTQISGPTVSLSDPNAETVSFDPSDVPPGGETLVFQLTVTNSLGLTSTEDVTVLVANPGDPHTGIYLQGTPDSGTDTPNMQTLLRQPIDGSFSLAAPSPDAVTIHYAAPSGQAWDLVFVPPQGQTLHTGTYTGTGNADPGDGDLGSVPGAEPEMLVTDNTNSCINPTGRFTVDQISFDDDGNVTAFAADFKQECDAVTGSVYPVLRGKVRYNSTVSLHEPTADGGLDRLIYSGLPLTLDGSASTAGSGTITGYTWTQLVNSGDPVVTLANAATAKPSFIVPNVPLGGRTLAFQLTATNSLGLTNQDVVNVQVGNENDSKTAFYYQSDVDDPDGQGMTALVLPGQATFDTGFSDVNADITLFPIVQSGFDQTWEFEFDGLGGDAPLQKGAYPGGTGFTFPGMIATDGACDQTGGLYVIRDVSYDQFGGIASLGVDFVRHCQGAVGGLRGAFRYNSKTPIQVTQPTAYAGPNQVVTSPGQVMLDGSNSFIGWNGQVHYQWTQVSGPTVRILGGAKPVASFELPASVMSTKGTVLAFQLVVSNSSGSSTAQVTVTAKQQFTSLVSFHSDAGDPIGQGQTASYPLPDGSLTVQKHPDNSLQAVMPSNGYWVLDFAAQNKQPLKIGTYSGATLYKMIGTRKPGLSISAAGHNCSSVSGDFTVLDVQYQGNAVSSLAVDFDQSCNGSSAGLHGKLRYHSAVP